MRSKAQCSKLFVRKTSPPDHTLVNGIVEYIWILENPTGRGVFSNFAGLQLCISLQILFDMFGNFARIFFQAALVGWFFKEII